MISSILVYTFYGSTITVVVNPSYPYAAREGQNLLQAEAENRYIQ